MAGRKPIDPDRGALSPRSRQRKSRDMRRAMKEFVGRSDSSQQLGMNGSTLQQRGSPHRLNARKTKDVITKKRRREDEDEGIDPPPPKQIRSEVNMSRSTPQRNLASPSPARMREGQEATAGTIKRRNPLIMMPLSPSNIATPKNATRVERGTQTPTYVPGRSLKSSRSLPLLPSTPSAPTVTHHIQTTLHRRRVESKCGEYSTKISSPIPSRSFTTEYSQYQDTASDSDAEDCLDSMPPDEAISRLDWRLSVAASHGPSTVDQELPTLIKSERQLEPLYVGSSPIIISSDTDSDYEEEGSDEDFLPPLSPSPLGTRPIAPARLRDYVSDSGSDRSIDGGSGSGSPTSAHIITPHRDRDDRATTAQPLDEASIIDVCCESLGPICDCEFRPTTHGISLGELGEKWQRRINACLDEETVSAFAPLGEPDKVKLGRLLDGVMLPFQRFLANEADTAELNLYKSDIGTTDPDAVPELDYTYDIDSVIARITTLAVYKGSFQVNFKPLFLSQIKQNPHVTFGRERIQIHKVKNIRLGHGLMTGHMSTYICFPNLEVKSSNHLSDQEMGAWFAGILLPAIKQVYPWNTRQHHPQSWGDVLSKVHRKKQAYIESIERSSINYNGALYNTSNELQALWDVILRLCEQRLDPIAELVERYGSWSLSERPFSKPLLLVVGHNLKLSRRCVRLSGLPDMCRAVFEDSFHFSEEAFPTSDRWMDWAEEITPRSENFVLVRKRACLEAWAKQFEDPVKKSHNTKLTYYNWAGTRDGAALTVELSSSHTFAKELSYIKAYSTVKECFASPLKGHVLFENAYFKTLGMAETLAVECLTAGRAGRSIPRDLQRKVLQCLETARRQCRDSLPSAFSSGVRMEFRSIGESIENIRDGQAESIRSSREHLNFFVFQYKEVETFYQASINRWLVLLEHIAAMPGDMPPDPSTAFLDYRNQLLYRTITVTALHMLQFLFDGDTAKHHKIWRGKWRGRKTGNARVSRERPRLGLDVQAAVATKGVIYLPDEYVNWDVHPPRFYRRISQRLAVNDLVEVGAARDNPVPTIRGVALDVAIRVLFRSMMERKADDGHDDRELVYTAAELCIRAYVAEILERLKRYWLADQEKEFKHAWPPELLAPPREEIHRQKLTWARKWRNAARCGGRFGAKEVLGGYWGLCPRIIGRLIGSGNSKDVWGGYGLNIIGARVAGKSKDVEDAVIWQQRAVQPFLSGRDHRKSDLYPTRRWGDQGFVKLVDSLSAIIHDVGGPQMWRVFEDTALPETASRYILAMPACESNKLMRLAKSGGEHNSKCLRVEFWVPRFCRRNEEDDDRSHQMGKDFTAVAENRGDVGCKYGDFEKRLSRDERAAQFSRKYLRALGCWTVMNQDNRLRQNEEATLYNPGWLPGPKQRGRMERAIEFMATLEKTQLEQEWSDGGDTSDDDGAMTTDDDGNNSE